MSHNHFLLTGAPSKKPAGRPARRAWGLLWAALAVSVAACGQNAGTTSTSRTGGSTEDYYAPEKAALYAPIDAQVFNPTTRARQPLRVNRFPTHPPSTR